MIRVDKSVGALPVVEPEDGDEEEDEDGEGRQCQMDEFAKHYALRSKHKVWVVNTRNWLDNIVLGSTSPGTLCLETPPPVSHNILIRHQ